MEKQTQKIEELNMLLRQGVKNNAFTDFSTIMPLNSKEQETFLALYTNDILTFPELAVKLNTTEPIARRILGNLVRKGIPLERELKGSTPGFSLNPDFKDLQAKENILDIDASVIRKVV